MANRRRRLAGNVTGGRACITMFRINKARARARIERLSGFTVSAAEIKIQFLTMSQSFPLYRDIFFTNILRILVERGMTNEELSERSGISASFIAELARGKANPSLRTMSAIADAVDVALPILLELTDLDRKALEQLRGGKPLPGLPKGYERVTVILTSFEAFIAKGQDEENRKKLAGKIPPAKH